ncbi:hypothetical protein [Dechloromonas agitata]|uniref:hypothetical protein n=1 Tax=Dechloromonas agitata TaxID=73030 RepID=UPI00047F5C79|nr:hypothetical protein [Dechloromonas agitata]
MRTNCSKTPWSAKPLSTDNKALLQLVHSEEIAKQPSALVLPEWTGLFGDLPQLLECFPKPTRTPFIHICASNQMLEGTLQHAEKPFLRRNCVTLGHSVDTFFYTVGTGATGYILAFDAQLPEIAQAFQIWNRQGFIPCLMNSRPGTVFIALPLLKEPGFTDFMREARMHPVEISPQRQQLIECAAHSPYLQDNLPFENPEVIAVWPSSALVGGFIEVAASEDDDDGH